MNGINSFFLVFVGGSNRPDSFQGNLRPKIFIEFIVDGEKLIYQHSLIPQSYLKEILGSDLVDGGLKAAPTHK